MKKFMRVLLCSAVVMALLAGLQMVAFANVENPVNDTLPATEVERNAATAGTTHPDIMPISNPDTGTESMVIPAAVALLAATTAIVTLAGKKK